MGGIESLNNKLCKCQCSFLRRNSFQLTKRQQDHQQMRVLCDWHKHGETEVSSLKIYPCISPSVQSLFLCLYPSQSHPAQHAQTAPLSRTPRFTPLSLTSKPRTQRGSRGQNECHLSVSVLGNISTTFLALSVGGNISTFNYHTIKCV